MFAEKALSLVKEVHQVVDALPPYNSELVQEVCREISYLTENNQQLVRESTEQKEQQGTEQTQTQHKNVTTVRLQHAAIQRNKRCLAAYHYNRLRRIRNMRWEFGSILPSDIKSSLSSNEFEWFKDYNRTLATYMRTLSDTGGVNLCVDTKPPKSLYVEVKCLSDYGKFELSDGSVINLKKNTRYFLPQRDCEEFIRQGIFQHILA